MRSEHYELNRRRERQVFLALSTLCAICLGLAVVLGKQPSHRNLLQLGDLSHAHIVEIRDASGHTMLSGEFRIVTDASGEIERDAALTDRDGSSVIGEVEIDIPGPNAPNQRQELEIDIIKLAPDQVFTVVIDDRPVTRFTTDDRGSIDLEIESAMPGDLSQPQTVPR